MNEDTAIIFSTSFTIYTPFLTHRSISRRICSMRVFRSRMWYLPTWWSRDLMPNPVVTRSICILPYRSSIWWCRNIQFTILSTPCSVSSIRTFRLLLPQRIESTMKCFQDSFSMAFSIRSIVVCSSSLYFPWNMTVDLIGWSAVSLDVRAYLSELAIIIKRWCIKYTIMAGYVENYCIKTGRLFESINKQCFAPKVF